MELNPNHEVTTTIRDHWHKIALLLMYKSGDFHAVITTEDLEALAGIFPGDMPAITICEKDDGLHVMLVPLKEGERLAREHGGLPS